MSKQTMTERIADNQPEYARDLNAKPMFLAKLLLASREIATRAPVLLADPAERLAARAQREARHSEACIFDMGRLGCLLPPWPSVAVEYTLHSEESDKEARICCMIQRLQTSDVDFKTCNVTCDRKAAWVLSMNFWYGTADSPMVLSGEVLFAGLNKQGRLISVFGDEESMPTSPEMAREVLTALHLANLNGVRHRGRDEGWKRDVWELQPPFEWGPRSPYRTAESYGELTLGQTFDLVEKELAGSHKLGETDTVYLPAGRYTVSNPCVDGDKYACVHNNRDGSDWVVDGLQLLSILEVRENQS